MKLRKMAQNQITILGCGTSSGVPLIGCSCSVCRSRSPKNRRTRASIWIQTRGKSLLVDSSIDLRQQALRERLLRVDAVLYTHPHADHIGGVDDLRSYNFLQKQDLPVYGNDWTVDELLRRFPYIFTPAPSYEEGGGTARLTPHRIGLEQTESGNPLNIQGVPVLPIPVHHGSKPCLGFRIDSVAYVTDCSYIPEASLDRLKGLSVLILDCLRIEKHGTHFHLDQALETVRALRPKKTILTHLGHDFDHATWNRKLSREFGNGKVVLAHDGMKIRWQT